MIGLLTKVFNPLKIESDDEHEKGDLRTKGYWDDEPSEEDDESDVEESVEISKHVDANIVPMDWILDLEASREVALFQASAQNDAKTARHLIRNGAIVNCQDADNHCTALHVACTYGNLAVAETLVRGGADAGLTNKEGKKAMDVAMQNGYRELVFLLNVVESEN